MPKNPQRLQYHFADLMKFIVVFSLSLALIAWSGIGNVPNLSWHDTLLMPMVYAFGIAVSLMRPRRAPAPRCELCGSKYATFLSAQPSGMCPSCRIARLPQSARRRSNRQSFVFFAVLLLLLGGTLVWPFWSLIDGQTGGNGTVIAPLAVLGVSIVLFAALVVLIAIVQIGKRFRRSRPGQALAIARTCSRDVGQSQALGDATVWGFGAKAPVPLLADALEAARKRIEGIVDRPIEAAPPLDVFVFDRRTALDAFLTRAVFVAAGAHDGMFIPWARNTIACTTELPPERLYGVDRPFRILFGYYWLAAAVSPRLPSWIQTGVASFVASGGDPDARARLNRKMISALARRRTLDRATLFEPAPKVLVRMLRNQDEFADFERYQQFVNQTWSMVEFLCGVDAPAGNAERFRAFVTGITPRTPLEADFEREFGYGFDALLAEWQRWVRQRGLGGHGPVPAAAARALRDRVLPLVRDRNAPVEQRLEAVREMGKGGHLLGADALIELLRTPDGVPVEDVVWSLEAISGRALGSAVSGWTGWWHSLDHAGVHADAVATAH